MVDKFLNHRLRQRTDGIWEVVWRQPQTNKVVRRSCGTRDEVVAARKLVEISLTGLVEPPEIVTIGYLLDRYMLHLQRRYSEKTTTPMVSKIDRLKSYFEKLPWDNFSQTDVESYIDFARRITRWGRGKQILSDGTVKKDLQVLRAALRHGHLHRVVPYEVRIEIRNLLSEPRTAWLTKQQMRRVLGCCLHREDRFHIAGFILIGLASGARKEAILELTWDQVCLPSTKIHTLLAISGSGTDPELSICQRYTETKQLLVTQGLRELTKGALIDFGHARGNKRRPKTPIGLNADLLAYLMVADRTLSHVISYRGKPIKSSIKKGLHSVGEDAKLPFKLTHHVLKRTCVTWMVKAGISFEVIEKLTNTTVATLKMHYSQYCPDLEKTLKDTFAL